MHIKLQALKTRQSPMQKALSWGENALKIAGAVKGIFEIGQTVYNTAQTVAPYAEAAAGLIL